LSPHGRADSPDTKVDGVEAAKNPSKDRKRRAPEFSATLGGITHHRDIPMPRVLENILRPHAQFSVDDQRYFEREAQGSEEWGR
jgi:hypothetical protein